MKKATIALLLVALFAMPTFAGTRCCGWEDPNSGVVLGLYGNAANERIVQAPEPVYAGLKAMGVQETPLGGTPQVYVAYIEHLVTGDYVEASFYAYDSTPGASPSTRIWGHYAYSGDVTSYAGSYGGNALYTAGTGWEQMTHGFTFADDGSGRDALVVEYRLYSSAELQQYYCDDVCVTAPDHATITLACDAPVAVEDTGWGQIKALYR